MKNSSQRSFAIWLFLLLVWMLVIYFKSAQTYQEQDLRPLLSEWISAPHLIAWLPHIEFTYDGGLVTWTEPYNMLEFYIRKSAHVTEYAILTFLAVRALFAKSLSFSVTLFSSALISILYAASDEWHQTFVAGRTGHTIDVAVDSIGVLLVLMYYVTFRRKIHR